MQENLSASGSSAAAPQLVTMLENSGIRWANAETKMNIYGVRVHLRILRRLSMAVVDSTQPAYQDSALYYFDRNEEMWGRKAPEVQMQESVKYFDSFQANPWIASITTSTVTSTTAAAAASTTSGPNHC